MIQIKKFKLDNYVYTKDLLSIKFYLEFNNNIINFSILLLCLLIFCNATLDYFKHNNKYIKIFNICMYAVLICFFIFKFFLNLKLLKISKFSLIESLTFLYNHNKIKWYECIGINTGLFGDSLILLMFFTGLICVILLGDSSLNNKISNMSIFYIFNLCTIFMVYTNNLLITFLSFEFIFLPTIWIVYQKAYTFKSDYAVKLLLKWTLFGSFLTLCSTAYLYGMHETLNYTLLIEKEFSTGEYIMLTLILFIGFGAKIPVFPFHYWLTQLHVEAPTGYSIFLSGYLVKAALYCLYMFNLVINNHVCDTILIIILTFSATAASFSLFFQVDIKKLIAWATIQEMTLITMFLIYKNNSYNGLINMFILMHGLLSTYLFFLIDVISKRYNTRNIGNITGITHFMPKMSFYTWFAILSFNGLPFTVKFLFEWSLLELAISTTTFYFISFIIIINFLSAIAFLKTFLSMLYGENTQTNVIGDLTDFETTLFNVLIFSLSTLTLLSSILY